MSSKFQLMDCQNPGNAHGDTAILVNFIVENFDIFITTSQYTWRRSKSVSIDTPVVETCFKHVDNDIHISYV
jgi:hypothetical protein